MSDLLIILKSWHALCKPCFAFIIEFAPNPPTSYEIPKINDG